MKKTAEETRRSTTPAASPPGFATASSQGSKASLPTARPGPLAHHLGEIAIMSGESEPAGDRPKQRLAASVNDSPVATVQARPNNTGLPDKLKGGIESLSGFDMSDVRVHFNSPRPARLQALAYTQGTHIHVAPGQERHLPHEAWHVVQQAHGRVGGTTWLGNGVPANNDCRLEQEAERMGKQAARSVPVFPRAESGTGIAAELPAPELCARRPRERSHQPRCRRPRAPRACPCSAFQKLYLTTAISTGQARHPNTRR